MHRSLARAAALALALLAGACAGANPYVAHREELARAGAGIDSGELSKADGELRGLLSETSGQQDKFVLQRYYAALLLTRAHLRAALGTPWYADPAPPRGVGIGGGAGSAAPGVAAPARVAHLVTAMLYASYGKDWAPQAASASRSAKGAPVLPEGLDAVGADNAQLDLDLDALAIYSRLGFRDKVEHVLEDSPALHELDGFEQVLDRSGVLPELRPWLYWTLFDYQRTRDELAAYPFGIRALESSRSGPGALPAEMQTAVSSWITSGSKYVWKCPMCDMPVVPELQGCQIDHTPHLKFYAELKPAAGGQ